MDTQDHKTTAISTGHEGHGVHLCHVCGWPFPNPHPSAKHRRAHKRVCGTIEGYKIIHLEEHDYHLAVSDDEHPSDEDEQIPSPRLVKENVEGSGKVGEKSNKSEDDVFSDAVTDFSDSGISPRLEEHFGSVKELDKSMEQKGVEGDLHGGGSLKVDETADSNEQSNDPRKGGEVTDPEPPLVNGTDQSGSVIPMTDTSTKAVLGQGQMKSEQDANIQVQEDNLASVALNSEEGQILDHTLTAVEGQEDLRKDLEVVKHDVPSQTVTLENLNSSEGANSVLHLAGRSTSNETVEVALVDETLESIDASVGVKEVSQSYEDLRSIGAVGENTLLHESLLSTPSAKPDEGSQTLDATKHSDVASMVSSVDKEVEPKASLADGENAANFDASEGEKYDKNKNENRNMEFKESFSVDTFPTPDSADKTFAPEDDQTTAESKKDVDNCEENSNGKLLETGNEKGEGASVKVKAVDSEARNLGELSKDEHSSLVESRDDGFEKSISGLDTVGSGGIGSELNHDIGDVLDKNAFPATSVEVTVSSIILGPSDNIDVTGNGDRVESVDVAKTMSDSKDNENVSSEKTPEQSIPEESTSQITDSESLSKNSADNVKASESIDTARVTSKLDHEDNVVLLREISEEASSTSMHLDVTSHGVEKSHSSEDSSTLKSVGIVPSGELDGNVLASGECSVTPSLKEIVPSPSDKHETCAIGDDKTVTKVVDVTSVDSKSLQAEVDEKLTKENDGISAVDLSGSSSSRSDSLEANCGSVVSDTLETISQKHKTEEDRSDTFEPPSFMTLVQSGGEGDQVKATKEIETVQNNQGQKTDALQAGWFPSLTNVVNESEGRKKKEEIIAKVTNWSPVKQQHSPLKSLLNEVKSPNTKQVPALNQKTENETKDKNGGVTTVCSVLEPEAHRAKDQETNKDAEEWNSPARYPIEMKKEKKKGRSYWVPFVCCSSVHRDL